MGYVQALNFHRGLASLAQRLASLAETRAFGALEENNSRCVAPRIESLLAGYLISCLMTNCVAQIQVKLFIVDDTHHGLVIFLQMPLNTLNKTY